MKKVLKVVGNKFFITGVAFAVWITYFDQNNLAVREEKNKEIRQTERNIAYLNAEIARMEREYNELKNNPERLEQYAREQYRLKKDNEDLYIIER